MTLGDSVHEGLLVFPVGGDLGHAVDEPEQIFFSIFFFGKKKVSFFFFTPARPFLSHQQKKKKKLLLPFPVPSAEEPPDESRRIEALDLVHVLSGAQEGDGGRRRRDGGEGAAACGE